MITHLLFDLDNVLYPSKFGLEKAVSERIDIFVSELLNISPQESASIRRETVLQKGYGTTIQWLIAEQGFNDIELYYKAIYPENEADALQPDPVLDEFLASIPLPKAILTNSPMDHTERVLNRLGIRQHFSHIFDIHFNNFKGKPNKDAFSRALEAMNAKPETTLFIDDYPEFVEGFLNIGGQALLMDDNERYAQLQYKRIKDLWELKEFL